MVQEESIDPRQLLVEVAKILKRLNIPYVVTGGMAVFVWGKPRFTADIDIVIQMKTQNVNDLAKTLRALSKASFIDEEYMQRALVYHDEFNFIDGDSGIKVDFWVLGQSQFDKNQLGNAVNKEVLGYNVSFISAEDLILRKLLWYQDSQSTRHLEDVESILRIQKKLDWNYLQKWAKIHSASKILESLWRKNRKAVSA